MTLCNIPKHKAKLSLDIIKYYFLHFEEIIVGVDALPRKRLSKEDLFHDLHRKCGMNRWESQMSYSIIKRVFRAFYHGSGEGGVPNPWLREQLKHTTECMWAHAATKTAQVYAAYEGAFMISQKALEGKIKNLYTELHQRMQAKPQPDENQECTCAACPARIMRESLKPVRVTTKMHNISDPFEEIYRREVDKMLYDQENNEEQERNNNPKAKCTCPTLKNDNNHDYYQEAAKLCNTGYGQGPFDCRWFKISKEEYEEDDLDPKIKLPEELPCQPCQEEGDNSSCDSECLCNCEVCNCESEEELECGEAAVDVGDDESSQDISLISKIEKEILGEEELSRNEIEDTNDDDENCANYSNCKYSEKMQNAVRQIY
ncbi:uncharacterized protein LOC133336988 [Musca vetustissima]|uniref:uncharacterized protein LOC133336988 n=1 Tax=Musca vetustissima TaxID=27455 RepID=UPI002AB6F9E0|nr:uncharacterized protein LOC133336988 [Musca vetustissima]